MKQFLLYLDETSALGKKFIIQDLDDTHVFILAEVVQILQERAVVMFAAVEHGPVLCSDSNILCLSWKGRVPKSEKEKPVCRRRYYEEGWLATGNGRGVVGVTFTSSHCRRDRNTPQRINFNLRGHNSERLVRSSARRLAVAEVRGRGGRKRRETLGALSLTSQLRFAPLFLRDAFAEAVPAM
ncbi:hypothetical protein COCON_G00098810 [Conger conger]|uniref:General transcription and DNA repair factor IIH subunit TFB5 n=1 Tax=Conger conger TaxID=82655 RepID=A0A9Q1I0X1_CONCO|nr:hypothetical protein COCON_G00098810 [Conger conger]